MDWRGEREHKRVNKAVVMGGDEGDSANMVIADMENAAEGKVVCDEE
jgi:hypothetical protein